MWCSAPGTPRATDARRRRIRNLLLPCRVVGANAACVDDMKPIVTKLTRGARLISALLLILTLPAVVQAQFNYTTDNGTITITGYIGPGGAVSIPDTIHGLPVRTIGHNAFYGHTDLTSIT